MNGYCELIICIIGRITPKLDLLHRLETIYGKHIINYMAINFPLVNGTSYAVVIIDILLL